MRLPLTPVGTVTTVTGLGEDSSTLLLVLLSWWCFVFTQVKVLSRTAGCEPGVQQQGWDKEMQVLSCQHLDGIEGHGPA